MEEFVKISKKRLANLLRSEMKLDALECGGVDNWSFYSEALNDPNFGDGKSYCDLKDELSDDDLINSEIKE